MRKSRQELIAKIPMYVRQSAVWKQQIYDAVRKAQRTAGVRYSDQAKLDVEVRFYFRGHKLTKRDLDNRLK